MASHPALPVGRLPLQQESHARLKRLHAASASPAPAATGASCAAILPHFFVWMSA